MVFGVFDRLHPGHISFLEQAREYGDVVIAVVARDAIVQELKNKLPHEDEETRKTSISRISHITHVVLSDVILGSYEVLNNHQPDIICLGYDQTALERDLRERMDKGEIRRIDMIRLNAHKPDIFHSSLR